MSADALILDQSWQQAAVFFAMGTAALVMAPFAREYDPALRWPGAFIVCAAFLWLGIGSLTWSAQIDNKGVAVHAPVGILQRSASISWDEMVAMEIIPCGWNQQGLHFVSRNKEITLPLDQIPKREISALISRVAKHRSARIAPDERTFFAQAERIVPSNEHLFRLRVRAAREQMASASP